MLLLPQAHMPTFERTTAIMLTCPLVLVDQPQKGSNLREEFSWLERLRDVCIGAYL